MISLQDTLPKLPVEAQTWINGLNRVHRLAAEYILNIVGEDSFIANWREHRFYQQKLVHDFTLH
jgi:hypothetical protein